MHLMRYCVLAIIFLALGALALAGDVSSVYTQAGVGVAHLSVSSVDVAALDTTDNVSSPEISLSAQPGAATKPTLTLSAFFGAASATSKVQVVRYNKDAAGNPINASIISNTFAADATDKWGGLYVSDAWSMDTGGFRYAKVFVRSISSSTTMITWSLH